MRHTAGFVLERESYWERSEIYVMNSDGTNQTRLTNNSATDYEPTFSPDGSKIAFTSNRDGNDEIYVMNSDGTNQRLFGTLPVLSDFLRAANSTRPNPTKLEQVVPYQWSQDTAVKPALVKSRHQEHGGTGRVALSKL
jgi:dipeptidyl aminopeptidase/acylaminoacyl peptidase